MKPLETPENNQGTPNETPVVTPPAEKPVETVAERKARLLDELAKVGSDEAQESIEVLQKQLNTLVDKSKEQIEWTNPRTGQVLMVNAGLSTKDHEKYIDILSKLKRAKKRVI